jgi:hypothetical protein
LVTGMLGLIAQRPVIGQSSGGNSAVQPGVNPTPSATAIPLPTSSNATPANQNRPLAVNPLTGLTTVSALDYHPLTAKERWELYWKQNYWSVGAYFGSTFTALIDQASNSPSEWGGGFAGFGRSLGSLSLSGMTQGTLQAAIAAALHEEVRYISSGRGGFRRRALHAVAFSFVTYNNQGRSTLNISNLSSYYAAAAISTTWIPSRGNVARYTVINGTEQLGLSVPVNIFQEFWPEIRHNILRRP